ncbi:UDP-N-acetylmuramyl peptide synthase [Legionella fairfieldensis]|uniref:UDP-N-acetylmuramyl peptide synthase n=1 Tax=Legionella fairfieldensis TaxID=45064 RepID=UPI000AC7958F|nr:UDP-N-acetylmuramyl peptide synthase [Legionella fairfieldensis]
MINKNTEFYYKSSKALLLPAIISDEMQLLELKLGKKHYFFRGTETPFNNSCSANLVADKYCTNKILARAGIPVAKAVLLHASDLENGQFEKKIAPLKFPLVAKPAIGSSRGDAVLCNIETIERLKNYLIHHFSYYEFIVIEEFHSNLKSYRVLVHNRQIIGVILRYPAHVMGDGKHNIEELIERTNQERTRINDALGPIVIDEECRVALNESGMDLNYIPRREERIRLGYTSNATRGGSFEALGNRICKENKRLLIRITELMNLNFAGIDVECEDINLPLKTSKGIIIEVNNRPSIKIHENPMQGKPNPVSKKIIRSLIYRHPLAYLHVLYTNRKTFFYVRSLILITILGLMYQFLI